MYQVRTRLLPLYVLGALILFASGALLAISGVSSPASAQDKSASGGAPQMSQEEMQKMMALATPGENHKNFEKMVGTWNCSIKTWMGPGEPTVTPGVAVYDMILGGRYLRSKQTGNFNGMAYEGMGLEGYDIAQKQYFSIWLDNMGTGVMMLTGQPTADGKGVNYSGDTFEPMQMKNVHVREEIRWTSDTSYTFTMYMDMPGPDGKVKETKVMEITGAKA